MSQRGQWRAIMNPYLGRFRPSPVKLAGETGPKKHSGDGLLWPSTTKNTLYVCLFRFNEEWDASALDLPGLIGLKEWT